MIIQNNTDKQWEDFGKKDPYYGVITYEKFHKENLSQKRKEDFFTSGEVLVQQILSTIRQKIDADFKPKRVLDFGCGVGRSVIPFGQVAEEVVGVDISDYMLAEAKKNVEDKGIKNVSFVKSTDDCSNIRGQYNLIHSYMVLQHIPVKRGMKILKNLLDHLEPGGVCEIQFPLTYVNRTKRVLKNSEKYVPLLGNLINLFIGRSFFAPRLQMNEYDLNSILALIHKEGECYISIDSEDKDICCAILYFKKKGSV